MGKNAKIQSQISGGYNNPFKSKFGNQKRNFKNKFDDKKKKQKPNLAEQWGKEKFVPKISNRTRDNNQRAGDAATPWGHFKNELLEKEREEAHSNAVNMNSADAQEILKQREQNYRRTLITSQVNQPTKWEKFNDEEKVSKNHKEAQTDSNGTKSKKQKLQRKNGKKNAKNSNFAGIKLEDFDAKKLSFQQKNDMRKVLTKGFMNIAEKKLERFVIDMKKKEKKKKQEKRNAEEKSEFDSGQERKRKKSK